MPSIALRNKVQATVDHTLDEAAADVTAVLTDGRRVHVRVDHAIGSLENPLSDAQLEAKFAALVVPVLGDARARHHRPLALAGRAAQHPHAHSPVPPGLTFFQQTHAPHACLRGARPLSRD